MKRSTVESVVSVTLNGYNKLLTVVIPHVTAPGVSAAVPIMCIRLLTSHKF